MPLPVQGVVALLEVHVRTFCLLWPFDDSKLLLSLGEVGLPHLLRSLPRDPTCSTGLRSAFGTTMLFLLVGSAPVACLLPLPPLTFES